MAFNAAAEKIHASDRQNFQCPTDGLKQTSDVALRLSRTTSGECRRKEVMPTYQFSISQSVRFRYHERMRSAAPGQYQVVGYQPKEGGEEPRYRIKSDLEQHERIARESELSQTG
jgi:hypothetical protein